MPHLQTRQPRGSRAVRVRAYLPQHAQQKTVHLSTSAPPLADIGDSTHVGRASQDLKRLAVTMRVLLHDKGQSRSLLGQLGRKEVAFWDSNNGGGFLTPPPFFGLVMMHVTADGVRYVAPLDDVPWGAQHNAFYSWWTVPVLRELSRAQLVLTVADRSQ